jgi:hypothetical protein
MFFFVPERFFPSRKMLAKRLFRHYVEKEKQDDEIGGAEY